MPPFAFAVRVALLASLLLPIANCTVTDIGPGSEMGAEHGGPGSEMGADDLADDFLCTTPVCAAAPCTAGCTFTRLAMNGCPTEQRMLAAATARDCPGYCDFAHPFGGLAGCRRFKSEDHCCTSDCHCYGSWSCWPAQSMSDPTTTAEICGDGYGCFQGYPPSDLGPPGACLDSGEWQRD